ncbi:MAG: hypothetical protein JSV11_12000 [Nitrospiraceae bacterium]|nr:MAG: hypothetical protein JSV11_12000 [Nitrospiraceae bacterium]
MFKVNCVTLTLFSFLVLCVAGTAGAAEMSKEDAHMKMHHLHVMMNKGVLLATEGSNLLMLSKTDMLPSVDDMMDRHGSEMISQSRPLIQRTMSAPVIMELHSKKYINDPLLHYTEQLGVAMIEAVDSLEKMIMSSSTSADAKKMSHLQTLLNHALEMAAEGSNLAILGQMGKTGKVMDTYSIKLGNQMMINAKMLLSSTLQGKTMQDLHASGSPPASDQMMRNVHSFAEAALKVIDMLITMPPMH